MLLEGTQAYCKLLRAIKLSNEAARFCPLAAWDLCGTTGSPVVEALLRRDGHSTKITASGQLLVTVVSDTTLHIHEHKSNETHHCLWCWDCTHDLQA